MWLYIPMLCEWFRSITAQRIANCTLWLNDTVRLYACMCVCFYGSKHWIETGRSFLYCFTTNHRTLWCSPQIWHGCVLNITRVKLRYWPTFTVLGETAIVSSKLKERREIQKDKKEISKWKVHKREQNCALLDYYAACSGNLLPTFRENLSVPYWPLKMEPISCPER